MKVVIIRDDSSTFSTYHEPINQIVIYLADSQVYSKRLSNEEATDKSRIQRCSSGIHVRYRQKVYPESHSDEDENKQIFTLIINHLYLLATWAFLIRCIGKCFHLQNSYFCVIH